MAASPTAARAAERGQVLEGGGEEESSGDDYDELGFALEGNGVGSDLGPELRQKTSAYALAFAPKACRRLKRFEVQRRKLDDPSQWLACKPKDLKTLVRKGIPPELRGEVWWSILGCEERRRLTPDAYARYLSENLDTKVAEEIDRDLARTFPNHRKFRKAEGRAELRNILRAFARHAPEVRYCQGLNFIAALFLIVLRDEERAFWALVCAIDSLGVVGYYTEGMVLLRADMQVLATLLGQHCPRVAKELNDHHIDLLSVCSEWHITWFAKSLPIPSVLRVWDALFFEGFKVIFRVGLGIFHRVEPELLRCKSFDCLMEQAKTWPRGQVEHNELLKASFFGSKMQPFRRRDLALARDNALHQIQCEDQAQRCRLEARQKERLRAQAAQAACEASKPAG